MDVYDYLEKKNLIRKEKDLNLKRTKKNALNSINKYTINVIKLDKKKDNLIIETEVDRFKKKKNNKISRYTDDINLDTEYYVNDIFLKYKDQLHEYEYIEDIEDLKLGGYVRYISMDDDFRFGGILIAIYNKKNLFETKLLLKNKNNNLWNIKFTNYYIFYKKHKTKNDKFRNLFLKVAKIE